jgi:hypothetical protein
MRKTITDKVDAKVSNVKFHAGHDGMRGLNCTLIFKGKKIAHVHDDAWGGEFEYRILGNKPEQREENRKLLNELQEEVKKYTFKSKMSGVEHEITYNIDILVDDLVNELEEEKRAKRDAKKGIVYKDKEDGETYIVGGGQTIPTLFKKYSNQSVVKALQTWYNDVKAEGHKILNGEYLKSVGVEL